MDSETFVCIAERAIAYVDGSCNPYEIEYADRTLKHNVVEEYLSRIELDKKYIVQITRTEYKDLLYMTPFFVIRYSLTYKEA